MCVVGAVGTFWSAPHNEWASLYSPPLSVWDVAAVALDTQLRVLLIVPFVLIAVAASLVRGVPIASKRIFVCAFAATILCLGVGFAPLPPVYSELQQLLQCGSAFSVNYPLGVTSIVVGYRAWSD